MRLLIFLPSIERGGCEQYALHVAATMRQRAHDVAVCLPTVTATASLHADFLATGCRMLAWHCGQHSAPAWPNINIQWNEAIALLQREHFDKVLLALPAPDSALGMLAACCELHCPCLVVFQLCSEPFTVPHWLKQVCQRAAGRWLWLIAVSLESQHRLANGLGVSPNHVHVLHNTAGFAVPTMPRGHPQVLRAQRGVPLTDILILTVARIAKQKGYCTLVKAARQLLDTGIKAHFVWVGQGKGEAHFRQALLHAGVSHAFRLTGWRTDISDWLRASDLFVLPSLWEGSPLVLAEAMAHACRIVATAVGGVPELLGPHCGWLVAPDCPKALAEGMLHALADKTSDRPQQALQHWMLLHHQHNTRLFALLENR